MRGFLLTTWRARVSGAGYTAGMYRYFQTVFFTVLVCVFPLVAFSQGAPRYAVDLELGNTGKVQVKETIVWYTNEISEQYIRDIGVDSNTRIDQLSARWNTQVQDVDVLDNGGSLSIVVDATRSDLAAGKQELVIHYRMDGQWNHDGEHSRMDWSVSVPQYSQYPVQFAGAVVSPEKYQLERVDCYREYDGIREPCGVDSRTEGTHRAYVASRTLWQDDQIVVSMEYQDNLRYHLLFAQYLPWLLGLVVCVVLLGLSRRCGRLFSKK